MSEDKGHSHQKGEVTDQLDQYPCKQLAAVVDTHDREEATNQQQNRGHASWPGQPHSSWTSWTSPSCPPSVRDNAWPCRPSCPDPERPGQCVSDPFVLPVPPSGWRLTSSCPPTPDPLYPPAPPGPLLAKYLSPPV